MVLGRALTAGAGKSPQAVITPRWRGARPPPPSPPCDSPVGQDQAHTADPRDQRPETSWKPTVY